MSTATKLRIGPADDGRALSLAEFLDAEEAPGYLYELARGIVEVSDVPNDPHGLIIDALHTHFTLWRLAHPGRILRISEGSGIQIVVEETDTDRHPDLSIVFTGKAPDPRGRRMPDLVVEVVSPGKKARDRDYIAKREDYFDSGIREYWIVDPPERRVTVLCRPDAVSEWTERGFRDGELIVSPLLPGIALHVDELWAGIDEGDQPAENP